MSHQTARALPAIRVLMAGPALRVIPASSRPCRDQRRVRIALQAPITRRGRNGGRAPYARQVRLPTRLEARFAGTALQPRFPATVVS